MEEEEGGGHEEVNEEDGSEKEDGDGPELFQRFRTAEQIYTF